MLLLTTATHTATLPLPGNFLSNWGKLQTEQFPQCLEKDFGSWDPIPFYRFAPFAVRQQLRNRGTLQKTIRIRMHTLCRTADRVLWQHEGGSEQPGESLVPSKDPIALTADEDREFPAPALRALTHQQWGGYLEMANVVPSSSFPAHRPFEMLPNPLQEWLRDLYSNWFRL